MKRLISALLLALAPLCVHARIESGPQGSVTATNVTAAVIASAGTLSNDTTGNAANAAVATNAFTGSVKLVHSNGTSTNFFGSSPIMLGAALTNAILIATNGSDVVLMSAGTFLLTNGGNVDISVPNGVTIKGMGPATIIMGKTNQNSLKFRLDNAGGVTFSDFCASNITFAHLHEQTTNCTWRNITIHNPLYIDVWWPSFNGWFYCTIDNCIVKAGGDIVSTWYFSEIRNSWIEGTDPAYPGGGNIVNGDDLYIANTVIVANTNATSATITPALNPDATYDNIIWLKDVTIVTQTTNCVAINMNTGPKIIGSYTTNSIPVPGFGVWPTNTISVFSSAVMAEGGYKNGTNRAAYPHVAGDGTVTWTINP